jgi:hypothetical protein
MSQPLSLYYTNAEQTFLLQVLKSVIDQAGLFLTGRVNRSGGKVFIQLEGVSGLQAVFQIYLVRQNEVDVKVVVTGKTPYKGSMDVSFKAQCHNLVPEKVVRTVLDRLDLDLQIAFENSEAEYLDRIASNVAKRFLNPSQE